MKTVIPEETLFKLAEASLNSAFRAHVAFTITQRFRSMHYMSSALICDCVVLNVLLNDCITPTSADKIITCMRRRNKSMYTTIDSAYFPIENRFDEYAKDLLGEKYEQVKALNLRTTNYIVYVLSEEISRNKTLDPNEVYRLAYDYAELINTELPHY